jgi:prostaglandin-endoperoxide synthase 2
MSRNTDRDGFANKLETYVLTHFRLIWRLLQSIPFVRKFLNRTLIRRAILKTKTRPHQFSLKSDYTSWDSLTDRTYTGRHLPPQSKEATASLPDALEVTKLFQRTPSTYRFSKKSTVLFTSFAQWFTDGFLRTDRQDSRKNTSNHEIDLCQIYGLKKEQTDALRETSGGRLKTSRHGTGEYPPLYFDEQGIEKPEFRVVKPLFPPNLPLDRKKMLFVGGVERLNVSIGYAMMSTLFVREHNRICSLLEQAYPTWDDERLFQTARNTMIVVLMRIVVEDYINHITPYHFRFAAEPWGFEKESWYRTNWMTIEFNLLYRWHSMVPNGVLVVDQFHSISDGLFNNALLTNNGLGQLFESASRQKAAELGLRNTHEHLVWEAESKSLLMGRAANLRSYNEYRELFGFPRVTDWSQITGDEELQKALKDLYRDVDQLEFFVGLFAEDVRENSALSPLIGRMVGVDAFSQALTNSLLSLHVFKPETFSEVGWKIIQETNSLAQVLQRNVRDDDPIFRVNFTQDGDEIDEPKGIGWPEAKDHRVPTHRVDLETAAQPESVSASFDERDLYIKK